MALVDYSEVRKVVDEVILEWAEERKKRICTHQALSDALMDALVERRLVVNAIGLGAYTPACNACKHWHRTDKSKREGYSDCQRYPEPIRRPGSYWCGEFELREED